jgi:hypothetical protein
VPPTGRGTDVVRRAVVWILLATGALAACQTSDAPAGPKPSGPTGPTTGSTVDADLSISADVAADRLRLSYRLRNNGTSPVVALNGVPAVDTVADPAVDPDAVYVTARDDGTVEIAQRAFAPPAGVDPAAPFQLAGTVVPGGGEVAGELTVPLPLRGRSPYGPLAGGDRLPDPVRRVVFCIGVLPDTMIEMRRDGTAERPVYGHLDFTVAAQRLVCAEPVPLTG